MDHIKALLLKKRSFVEAIITPRKVSECVLLNFPTFKGLKIKYLNGTLWLRGPASLMSEVFLKKQQLVTVLMQEFPQIKKIKVL